MTTKRIAEFAPGIYIVINLEELGPAARALFSSDAGWEGFKKVILKDGAMLAKAFSSFEEIVKDKNLST